MIRTPEIVTVREAAERYQIAAGTLRQWISRGKLSKQRRGFVDAAELRAVLLAVAARQVIKTIPQPTLDYDDLVTVTQAAGMMGVAEGTVRSWARRGYLDKDGVRRKLEMRGLDKKGRQLYLFLDVAKAECATRGRTTAGASGLHPVSLLALDENDHPD